MATLFDIKKLQKNPIKYVSDMNNEDLIELLKYLSNAYYNEMPRVNDNIYDILVDILKSREENIVLDIGSNIKGKKEKLPFPMGSLTKIKYGTDKLKLWKIKHTGPYFLSAKLDGISAQIYKNNKGDISMYIRGNGVEGKNISHLLKYIMCDDIDFPLNTSVRGELIMSSKNFKKIKETKMKTARDAISGLVNSNNINEKNKKIAELINFVAYAILEPRHMYDTQMKLLKKYNFDVVDYEFVKDIDEELLKDKLLKFKDLSKFKLDGLVCIDDSVIHKHVSGYQLHEFAFKMLSNEHIKETTVINVLWKPSKDGYLIPKIKIEPVELLDSTIKYATAFNAKYIVDNNIGPGAKIKVVKSGDIIPYILKVIKGSISGPQMPPYKCHWNDTNVDLILESDDAKGQPIVNIKVINHFFSTIGVQYMGEGVIKKFVDNGYNTIEEILMADQDKLQKINGFGKKLVTKLYDEINKAFDNMTIEQFMCASHIFGRGLGIKKMNLIVNAYSDILTIPQNEIYDKLLLIKGFSYKQSKLLAINFQKFLDFYEKIDKIKKLPDFGEKSESSKSIDNKFDGKSFVFTGFRDKDLEKNIISNGGKINSSVTSKTHMVIYADDIDKSTSKFLKATELEIAMMSKTDFMNNFFI